MSDLIFRAFLGDKIRKQGFLIQKGKPIIDIPLSISGVKLVDSQYPFSMVVDDNNQIVGLYNFYIPTTKKSSDGKNSTFETFMDMNPELFEYGLQIQLVAKPKIGKVINFFIKSSFGHTDFKFGEKEENK